MAVFELPDGYVISSRRRWRPGVYADRKAATYALQFTDDEINSIWLQSNRGPITTDELRALRSRRSRRRT